MQQKAFLKIRQISIELPGAILRMANFEHIRSGWVVKIKDHQNLEGEDGMIEALNIAADTTKTIAGWTDNEQELWDVIEVFDNEEDAIKAGKENGQMTIYQIETGTLRWLQ